MSNDYIDEFDRSMILSKIGKRDSNRLLRNNNHIFC